MSEFRKLVNKVNLTDSEKEKAFNALVDERDLGHGNFAYFLRYEGEIVKPYESTNKLMERIISGYDFDYIKQKLVLENKLSCDDLGMFRCFLVINQGKSNEKVCWALTKKHPFLCDKHLKELGWTKEMKIENEHLLKDFLC